MYVNLPVKDLKRSVAFFAKLGFEFDPRFTDENATSMIIGPDSFVMLLVEDFFARFTKKSVADASASTEVIVALSASTREEVDTFADAAMEAGASASNEPVDEGGMYSRSFADPDGHLWEIGFMDMSQMPG